MKKRDNLPLNYKERLNSRTSFLVSVAVLVVLCLVFNQMDYTMIRQPAAQAKKAADLQKQKEEEAAATDSAEDASAETAEEDTQEADEPAEAEQKEAPVAKSKRVHPDPKKPSKPRKAKKVDLKALLEEDNFKESKYDDEELHRMQQAERGGRKDKGDSKASFLKGFQ